MAETKTKPTSVTVEDYIAALEHSGKRADAQVLDTLFRKHTGERGVMWGPSIIGYGSYRYKYGSGHEGVMCRLGFSPRQPKHSLYISCSCDGEEDPRFLTLLERLGTHSRSKACLYVNKLADIDLAVLEEMIALSWKNSFEIWPR